MFTKEQSLQLKFTTQVSPKKDLQENFTKKWLLQTNKYIQIYTIVVLINNYSII